jgi:hypothetical protein
VANPKRIFSTSFYAILFCVGIGTFFIHELAHWLAGVALGHDMIASPNHVWSRSPMPVRDQSLVSAAGPLITIAQGVIGFWLVRRHRSQLGFALLYMAFFMRLVAAGISIFNPNDEARVSQLMGVGTWTLPLTVVAGLSFLFLVASRELKLKIRDQFFCYVVASIVIALIVGVDKAFWTAGPHA